MSSPSAGSTIQAAIDELSSIKANKKGLSVSPSIDSTLNALDHKFPFIERGARRHAPSTDTHEAKINADIGRCLGQYSPSDLNTHPYNPLTHWGSASSLSNPYPPYGSPRINNNAKDTNNPRKKSYEDKMDKQQLEHILFSAPDGHSLNAQKQRMREKLRARKKQSEPVNKPIASTHAPQKGRNKSTFLLQDADTKSSNKNRKKKKHSNQRPKHQRQMKNKSKKQMKNKQKKQMKNKPKKQLKNTHTAKTSQPMNTDMDKRHSQSDIHALNKPQSNAMAQKDARAVEIGEPVKETLQQQNPSFPPHESEQKSHSSETPVPSQKKAFQRNKKVADHKTDSEHTQSNKTEECHQEKRKGAKTKVSANHHTESMRLQQQVTKLQMERNDALEQMERNNLRLAQCMAKLNEQTAENERLKIENNVLQNRLIGIKNECKKLHKHNNELQRENERLQSMDHSQYLLWDSKEVGRWIVALNPRYKRYEEKLLAELAEEGICGQTLCHVKMTDIKDWGIKNIVDRQDVFSNIKKLLQQRNEQTNCFYEVEGC